MNDSKFRYILYLIVGVIISTIAIQVYWNYKNYLTNKQQLANDVQVSLDNAVDQYYENLAQESTIAYAIDTTIEDGQIKERKRIETIIEHYGHAPGTFHKTDSIFVKDSVSSFSSEIKLDTLVKGFYLNHEMLTNDTIDIEYLWRKGFKSDSINAIDFSALTSKVFISIVSDSLELNTINDLFIGELQRKNITIKHGFTFKNPPSEVQTLFDSILKKATLKTSSKSSFLPKGSSLNVHFTNNTKLLLKRVLSGILISTLLVLAVISCLFYLLKIIKHQKQLSEVKNDLISNITHEFKTPIATIGVALESIKSFNVIDDKEKTKTYLDMSSSQLAKLNTMVEKLLETATLDSENLELNTNRYNISEVITTVIEKHKMQNDKQVNYDIDDNVFINVDVFHFENAINNIIDNAFKYGGNQIDVLLKSKASQIEIEVTDNGTSLSKANKDRIFEKFYRVSKGNTHDIKGFGIGLYYTKKIIEKHKGSIHIDLDKTKTTFKIVLPYA